jgi:acyl carrier protein
VNNEVRSFVLTYFREKGLEAPSSDDELLAYDFIDEGFLDSLGVVELITALEDKFNIRFSAQEMRSVEFGIVGGLINLVERSLNMQG